MGFKSVSSQTLQRLPVYLNYLKGLPREGAVNISATGIAEALHMNDVQVRKDLAMISEGGRPKIGYVTEKLIFDMERFLGYDNKDKAVIAGAGHLGRAFIAYGGFEKYGLDIVAAFDTDTKLIGTRINGKEVFAAEKIKSLCSRLKVRIGIITVPENEAQTVCEAMIEGGVMAIWNFAPVHLNVQNDILVKNENMACSLAMLSNHLKEKFST
jgi:redox-sensing transcriptional repressor